MRERERGREREHMASAHSPAVGPRCAERDDDDDDDACYLQSKEEITSPSTIIKKLAKLINVVLSSTTT